MKPYNACRAASAVFGAAAFVAWLVFDSDPAHGILIVLQAVFWAAESILLRKELSALNGIIGTLADVIISFGQRPPRPEGVQFVALSPDWQRRRERN